MFETYFDDSGTSAQSDIAIAACYVSTASGWRQFEYEWNRVRLAEHFDVFHMAEFVAPREHGHRPWCDWSSEKKDRVYSRLANIINDHKRIGVACAIPKTVYDEVPIRLRGHWGMEHYTYAVRLCLTRISEWRWKSLIRHPIKYIFDWETPGSSKHEEISDLMNGIDQKLKPIFGMEGRCFSFMRRKDCEPLQAADILAWQMNSHMRKLYPNEETEETFNKFLHRGFRQLRENQEMDLGFLSEANKQAWIEKIEQFEASNGLVYPE